MKTKSVLAGVALLLSCTLVAPGQQQYQISTVAGGAVLLPTPVPAANASFPAPVAVAVDASGNFYFTAENCVFKVDSTRTLTRIAGVAVAGYSGDGGPATSARLSSPLGLAVDTAGNLYVADNGNVVIRKVAANGIITTFAGNGTRGYSGDGGPATAAQLGLVVPPSICRLQAWLPTPQEISTSRTSVTAGSARWRRTARLRQWRAAGHKAIRGTGGRPRAHSSTG